MVLVHGLVTHPEYGYRHVHAWCELDGMVIDTSQPDKLRLPKVVYYILGGVAYVKRYTLMDALHEMNGAEHYGPWDELLYTYQELALQREAQGLDWVIAYQDELNRIYKGRLANLGELELLGHINVLQE